MTNKIDVNKLLDFQLTNKIMLTGISNHFDVITAHVGLIHSHLSSLFGPFIIQASNPNLKVPAEIVMDKMKVVLEHTLSLCSACEFEIPDENTFVAYDESTDHSVRKDLILTLADMMQAALDILHIVHVDLNGDVAWGQEELPQDFESDIISIINGIKNIGNKYSFTVGDLVS